MIENIFKKDTMVKPLRDFIVVEKEEENNKTKSGLFLAPSADEKITFGKVLAVGSGQIAADGKSIPLEVSVGEKVAFNKHMAVELKVDDKTFLLLREEHVMCVVPN